MHAKDLEFEKFRQESVVRPESKLQAELSIAQLEKVWPKRREGVGRVGRSFAESAPCIFVSSQQKRILLGQHFHI